MFMARLRFPHSARRCPRRPPSGAHVHVVAEKREDKRSRSQMLWTQMVDRMASRKGQTDGAVETAAPLAISQRRMSQSDKKPPATQATMPQPKGDFSHWVCSRG